MMFKVVVEIKADGLEQKRNDYGIQSSSSNLNLNKNNDSDRDRAVLKCF